jgi:hypothetical protein
LWQEQFLRGNFCILNAYGSKVCKKDLRAVAIRRQIWYFSDIEKLTSVVSRHKWEISERYWSRRKNIKQSWNHFSAIWVILPAMAFIAAVPVSALAANPDIGGDPVYTEQDYFSAGDWGMTVYSYVFDNSSSSVPEIFPNFILEPGEILFMYLLDSNATKVVSVDHFAIGNPELFTIHTVGCTTDVVPAGYDVGDHQDPYRYCFSDLAEATIFTYSSDVIDPWCTLEPGEYSLVYYVAITQGYGALNATADGGGIGDNQLVPGPSFCIVDFKLFAKFADHWFDTDCNGPNNDWCRGADLDYSGDVNFVDLSLFVDEWLRPCPPDWPSIGETSLIGGSMYTINQSSTGSTSGGPVVTPASSAEANPDIGGDPIHTEEDYFSAGDWGMTVYSYVFDNSSSSVPEIYPGFELDPNEMLFMYLLDSNATKTVSVDHFAIGNPELLTIHTVDHTTNVVPAGYDVDDHQDPYLHKFSDLAEATIFTYSGDIQDQWCPLEPGEYSLVYYIVESTGHIKVSATADGGGIGDNQLVPGPQYESTN